MHVNSQKYFELIYVCHSLLRGKEVRGRVANPKMSHLNTGDMVNVFPGIFLEPQRIYLNRKIIEKHDLHLWFGGLEVGENIPLHTSNLG